MRLWGTRPASAATAGPARRGASRWSLCHEPSEALDSWSLALGFSGPGTIWQAVKELAATAEETGLPDCPKHGKMGTSPTSVKSYEVRLGGSTTPKRPRPFFRCNFELMDGTVGRHTFREPIPRLKVKDASCPRCGHHLAPWQGDQVIENYWFPAHHIAEALAHVADGSSFRKAAEDLRKDADRPANSEDKRRGNKKVYSKHSSQTQVIAWLVQTFAPVLHRAFAPQHWPTNGILAVDSLKINFNSTGKPAQPSAEAELVGVRHSLDDMLDVTDPDEVNGLSAISPPAPPATPPPTGGGQGGIPSWQVLAAYGYEPRSDGTFPRDERLGKPWLFRGYHQPNALVWAHFFRQLSGAPAYIVCDMAQEIRLGVEVAWPNPATRPKVISCEYHVGEALRRRVAGDQQLEQAAGQLFASYGRWVSGKYKPHASTGRPGSWRRAYPFARFRRLAAARGHPEFRALFDTPTWRRIIEQAVQKDGTLRYSTGGIEAAIKELGRGAIAKRGEMYTNRYRTDCLLMLFQLSALHEFNPERFSSVIGNWIREHGTPTQDRQVDKRQKGADTASLHLPLPDADLQKCGLMTHMQFAAWAKLRTKTLQARRAKDKYHGRPSLKKAINQQRVARRKKRDPANLTRKNWYLAHAQQQRASARQRKAAAFRSNPEHARALKNAQQRRRYARRKNEREIAAKVGITPEAARWLLAEANGDASLIFGK